MNYQKSLIIKAQKTPLHFTLKNSTIFLCLITCNKVTLKNEEKSLNVKNGKIAKNLGKQYVQNRPDKYFFNSNIRGRPNA